MEDILMSIISYTAPSIVVGIVAYYFFLRLSKSEEAQKRFDLFKEDKKVTLPVRLQAYERMTLVMERINPSKLLIRITPTSEDKELYVQKLVQSIEQEFEHNLSQQIYISEKCWNVLMTSKNATSHIIKKTAENSELKSAQELREAVLQKMIDGNPPSQIGLTFIKEEVKELF
ncbi:MAG: hypothetical protein PSN34_15440 [Urechidicola sp.]|nr:hypothetical protein [Urechidicola sp.]